MDQRIFSKVRENVDTFLASLYLLDHKMLSALLQVQVVYLCILQRVHPRISTKELLFLSFPATFTNLKQKLEKSFTAS